MSVEVKAEEQVADFCKEPAPDAGCFVMSSLPSSDGASISRTFGEGLVRSRLFVISSRLNISQKPPLFSSSQLSTFPSFTVTTVLSKVVIHVLELAPNYHKARSDTSRAEKREVGMVTGQRVQVS